MSESQIKQRVSPTPSEAGRAQLTSCSSSETDEHSVAPPPPLQPEAAAAHAEEEEEEHDYAVIEECRRRVSDIEIEDVPLVKNSSPALNEQQCIAQIIKTELRRPPHVLVKSKSVLEEQEPSCILRHNQRRELESSVVRSDSISCAMMAKMAKETPPSPAMVSKLKERLLQRHAPNPTGNSWRRSNGWKRVTSPVAGSAKKVSASLPQSWNMSSCSEIFAGSNKDNHGAAKELPAKGAAHTYTHMHTHDINHILHKLILLLVNAFVALAAKADAEADAAAAAATTEAAGEANTTAAIAAAQIQNSSTCTRASFLCQLRDAPIPPLSIISNRIL